MEQCCSLWLRNSFNMFPDSLRSHTRLLGWLECTTHLASVHQTLHSLFPVWSYRLWSGPFDSEPVPGRCQSLQRGRPVPETAHRIRVSVHQNLRQIRPVQPFQMQQGLAPFFRPRAAGVHARAAFLPLQWRGLFGETPPDNRAELLVRGSGEAQLYNADEELQGGFYMQVRSETETR